MMKKLLVAIPLLILTLIAVYSIGKYLYMQPKYARGETAADFSAQLLNGENFQLSDLKGKYVLLDFWGSWCPPCRAENPKVKQLYHKFNQSHFKSAKGFEVVSIAIEKNKKRWIKAIQQDGLQWKYQIMDLTTNFRFFNSPIAKKYSIKEIPTKYLLNPNGEIIGVNLSAAEINDLLSAQIQ